MILNKAVKQCLHCIMYMAPKSYLKQYSHRFEIFQKSLEKGEKDGDNDKDVEILCNLRQLFEILYLKRLNFHTR